MTIVNDEELSLAQTSVQPLLELYLDSDLVVHTTIASCIVGVVSHSSDIIITMQEVKL